MTPLEQADERYRLARVELAATGDEIDNYQKGGGVPPSTARRDAAFREVLASQTALMRLGLGIDKPGV